MQAQEVLPVAKYGKMDYTMRKFGMHLNYGGKR